MHKRSYENPFGLQKDYLTKKNCPIADTGKPSGLKLTVFGCACKWYYITNIGHAGYKLNHTLKA